MKVEHYLSLIKPRLSALVILTTAVGYAIAPGSLPVVSLFFVLLGTSLIVASANAFNCYLERDTDQFMERTKDRPLVTKAMTTRTALIFSWSLLFISLGLLYRFSNPLTTYLGLLGFVFYVCLYTPMKRTSSWALAVGAIPGAIPPMMGWTAITGTIDLAAWILFSILFVWQLPHFISIALFRFNDYKNAGMKTLPVVVGERWAQWHMLCYSAFLLIISFAPFFFGFTGELYLAVVSMLGISFCLLCFISFFRQLHWARTVFIASLIYLPLVLGTWVLDHWWIKI